MVAEKPLMWLKLTTHEINWWRGGQQGQAREDVEQKRYHRFYLKVIRVQLKMRVAICSQNEMDILCVDYI